MGKRPYRRPSIGDLFGLWTWALSTERGWVGLCPGPQRLDRSISMRRKPMPLAVLAAASMLLNTRQPPRCRSSTTVSLCLPNFTRCKCIRPPSAWVRSSPWQTRPGRTSTSLAVLPHQISIMIIHNSNLMLPLYATESYLPFSFVCRALACLTFRSYAKLTFLARTRVASRSASIFATVSSSVCSRRRTAWSYSSARLSLASA